MEFHPTSCSAASVSQTLRPGTELVPKGILVAVPSSVCPVGLVLAPLWTAQRLQCVHMSFHRLEQKSPLWSPWDQKGSWKANPCSQGHLPYLRGPPSLGPSPTVGVGVEVFLQKGELDVVRSSPTFTWRRLTYYSTFLQEKKNTP